MPTAAVVRWDFQVLASAMALCLLEYEAAGKWHKSVQHLRAARDHLPAPDRLAAISQQLGAWPSVVVSLSTSDRACLCSPRATRLPYCRAAAAHSALLPGQATQPSCAGREQAISGGGQARAPGLRCAPLLPQQRQQYSRRWRPSFLHPHGWPGRQSASLPTSPTGLA